MTTELQTIKRNITVDELKDLMESYNVINKTPDEFYEETRSLMWVNERVNSFGVCAMCDTCGGSSASFCECRYKEFSPNERDVFRFLLINETNNSLNGDINESMADGFDKIANSITDKLSDNLIDTLAENPTDNLTNE